jgi:hypothetical protein
MEDPQQAARPERDVVLQGELSVLQYRVWIRKMMQWCYDDHPEFEAIVQW